MDNLLLICPFCKKTLKYPKGCEVAWCNYCRAEEDNGNNDWSLFQVYINEYGCIFDMVIWFGEFCLNTYIGDDGSDYANIPSIIIKRKIENHIKILVDLDNKFDYKPDADYLESKMKLYLTFS